MRWDVIIRFRDSALYRRFRANIPSCAAGVNNYIIRDPANMRRARRLQNSLKRCLFWGLGSFRIRGSSENASSTFKPPSVRYWDWVRFANAVFMTGSGQFPEPSDFVSEGELFRGDGVLALRHAVVLPL